MEDACICMDACILIYCGTNAGRGLAMRNADSSARPGVRYRIRFWNAPTLISNRCSSPSHRTDTPTPDAPTPDIVRAAPQRLPQEQPAGEGPQKRVRPIAIAGPQGRSCCAHPARPPARRSFAGTRQAERDMGSKRPAARVCSPPRLQPAAPIPHASRRRRYGSRGTLSDDGRRRVRQRRL